MTTTTNKLLQAVFRVHGIGQSVEDEELTQEMIDNHGIDEKGIAAVKKLFTEQLKGFRKAANKARAYHLSRTFEGFGSARLIVATEQKSYIEKMEKFIATIQKEIAAFIDNYPAHIEREKQLKNSAFRAEDYPPHSALANPQSAIFKVQFLIVPMAEPGEALKKQLIGTYAEKYEAALKNATESVRRQTLGMMMTLIAQTAESLAGDGPIVDSENKKGPMAKLREFMERIPDLNITGDPQIAALAAECQKKLNVSADLLRNSKIARKQVAGVALDIAQRFGAMGQRKLAA